MSSRLSKTECFLISRTPDLLKSGLTEELADMLIFLAKKYSKNFRDGVIINTDGAARYIRTDGGEGSGNFGHKGRPGEIGGSAPNGGANSAKTAEKLSTVKESLSQKDAEFKCNYLKRAGVISNHEAEILMLRISGDKYDTTDEKRAAAEARIEECLEQYFESVEKGYESKSLECEGQDAVAAMTDEEAEQWLAESRSRKLTEEESKWAKDSKLQRAVIDMGLTGTPQVVCQEDFDRYMEEHEEDGYPVIYRGVRDSYDHDMTAAQIHNQLLYDEDKAYMGSGIYGDGLYFSTSKEESMYDYAGGEENNVITGTINAEANVLEVGSNDFFNSPELRKAILRVLCGEEGTAAACAGYDAIKVVGGNSGNSDYYVVLNRAALIIADPMDKLNTEYLK